MRELTAEQLDNLRHSLGVQFVMGKWTKPYRNYFNIGKDCTGYEDIKVLVDLGLMEYCGNDYYSVTAKGREIALADIEVPK